MIMKRERTHEHDEGIEKATPTSTYQQRFRSLKKTHTRHKGKNGKTAEVLRKIQVHNSSHKHYISYLEQTMKT